jgi:putative transposase
LATAKAINGGQAVQVRNALAGGLRQLPKLGWMRFRPSRPLGGELGSATMAKGALGWHVSFGVATATKLASHRRPGYGMDFGVNVVSVRARRAGTTPHLMPDAHR